MGVLWGCRGSGGSGVFGIGGGWGMGDEGCGRVGVGDIPILKVGHTHAPGGYLLTFWPAPANQVGFRAFAHQTTDHSTFSFPVPLNLMRVC